MAAPDPIGVAEQERDHVASLLAAHEHNCTTPRCGDCASLTTHLDRTERQLALLTPPAEQHALFDP